MVTAAVLVVIGVSLGVMAASDSDLAAIPPSDVCGVVALAGGPAAAVGVRTPALLHRCPSGSRMVATFDLLAGDGSIYPAYVYAQGGWSAQVPAGSYEAINRQGCNSPGASFLVAAGRTRFGVIIWVGCLYR
jgi:hypothetical protein